MLPDNIKNKCHIVDTGAMDSNSLMETMKQYADTGRINSGQKGVYLKGDGPKCDKPEIGIGHPEYYKKKGECGTLHQRKSWISVSNRCLTRRLFTHGGQSRPISNSPDVSCLA